MIDKDTLLQASDRWGTYYISKSTLGLHIVLFWWWALPLYGVLWLLSRPFHYIGELAEVIFQIWKIRQDPPKRDYVHDFDELWGSAKGCWGTCCKDDDDDEGLFTPEELAAMASPQHLYVSYDRPTQAYYTDEDGVDHPLPRFLNGERVLFAGDLYDVYAVCEPTYILRDPTGSVMSSREVSESQIRKIDVKKQR